jgi:putative ABC transport system permease protein
MQEQCREARGISQLDVTLQDVRYALRSFVRNPGFTIVAVLTLALGIGANTAIFSVVNAVLLRPLPFFESDRLMTIWERNTSLNTPRDPVAPANFLDWQKANTGFKQIAGFRYTSFALTGMDEPEQVPALAVSEICSRHCEFNRISAGPSPVKR